jgi:Mor family transcriptional regulator
MTRVNYDDTTPDIVSAILAKVTTMIDAASPAVVLEIEAQIRQEHGGQRVYVQKTRRSLSPEKRRAVFSDGMTAMSDADIAMRHKISRATLYRIIKRGGID